MRDIKALLFMAPTLVYRCESHSYGSEHTFKYLYVQCSVCSYQIVYVCVHVFFHFILSLSAFWSASVCVACSICASCMSVCMYVSLYCVCVFVYCIIYSPKQMADEGGIPLHSRALLRSGITRKDNINDIPKAIARISLSACQNMS